MAQTKLTSKAVLSFMNARTLIQANDEGKRVQLVIRGNGSQPQDVKDKAGVLIQSVVEPGTVFQTIIFNTNSNSGIAMANELNKKLLKEGMVAEKAGNADLAHEKFNAFLNAVSVSFNVPTTSSILEKLTDRVHIAAVIVKVTTPNGSLLTIDPKSISVLAPEKLAPTAFALPVDEPEENKEGGDIKTPEELLAGATA